MADMEVHDGELGTRRLRSLFILLELIHSNCYVNHTEYGRCKRPVTNRSERCPTLQCSSPVRII